MPKMSEKRKHVVTSLLRYVNLLKLRYRIMDQHPNFF